MKTAKYRLEIEFLDTAMCQAMDITKKEYTRQLAFMRQQVRDTADNECPVHEIDARSYDHEGLTETVHQFASGCCVTFLIALECKEGYRFTK